MDLLNTLKDRSVLAYGAIALTLLVLALVLMETERPVARDPDPSLRGDDKPDGFIEGGSYRSYDDSGRLTSQIHSRRAEQFNDAGYIRMESPAGVLFEQPSRLPWMISADSGRYQLDREILKLSDDVLVVRQSGEGRTSRLETQRLTLDNRRRLVHTDAPVALYDPYGETRAIGMHGLIDERVLEFRQQVEGTYQLE
ncbi:MAG: LPS export ABC transporter periplasmic protein LptC [Oleiphilaceae bacterium]|nr:LPS export ABC transporter periplasmic protein LptC [Oleiphilaceae bacterium]